MLFKTLIQIDQPTNTSKTLSEWNLNHTNVNQEKLIVMVRNDFHTEVGRQCYSMMQ